MTADSTEISETSYVLMVACGGCPAKLAVGDTCPHVRAVEKIEGILVVTQAEPHPFEILAFQSAD